MDEYARQKETQSDQDPLHVSKASEVGAPSL